VSKRGQANIPQRKKKKEQLWPEGRKKILIYIPSFGTSGREQKSVGRSLFKKMDRSRGGGGTGHKRRGKA